MASDGRGGLLTALAAADPGGRWVRGARRQTVHRLSRGSVPLSSTATVAVTVPAAVVRFRTRRTAPPTRDPHLPRRPLRRRDDLYGPLSHEHERRITTTTRAWSGSAAPLPGSYRVGCISAGPASYGHHSVTHNVAGFRVATATTVRPPQPPSRGTTTPTVQFSQGAGPRVGSSAPWHHYPAGAQSRAGVKMPGGSRWGSAAPPPGRTARLRHESPWRRHPWHGWTAQAGKRGGSDDGGSSGMRFRAIRRATRADAGLEVPAAVVQALGGGARPRVTITVNGHSWQSRIAIMRGRNLIGLSNANRQAAGVMTGDEVEVDVELERRAPGRGRARGLRQCPGRQPGRACRLRPAGLQPQARARAGHRGREEAGNAGAADREGPGDARDPAPGARTAGRSPWPREGTGCSVAGAASGGRADAAASRSAGRRRRPRPAGAPC